MSWVQRTTRLVLPVAGALALIVSAWAVVLGGSGPGTVPTETAHPRAFAAATAVEANVSRSLDVRPPLPEQAERHIAGRKYASVALNVYAGADDNSPVLAEVPSGKSVAVTGKKDGIWAQIVHKGAVRWVRARFLTATKPVARKPAAARDAAAAKPAGGDRALGGKACASGSAVESGLQPDTIRVHRAVCAQFPQIQNYGGLRSDGEHGRGRALDIMTSERSTGDAIAAFVQRHARELGASQIIWQQRIWTVQRASEGWRDMPSRGSATADHRDHVHVTTYGNSGTA